MIREELFVFDEDGNRKQIELNSPSGITLKWTTNMFSDLSKLTSSYSYTFKIPMTRSNRDVFDMAEDIRHSSSMLHKKVDAEFYINGVCLCPNANLYISEIGSEYSCVMTWRVLKGFQTLKENGKDINELTSVGSITWKDGDESLKYGNPSTDLSNNSDVVYPVYDAGVPYVTGYPPKPAMPVYRLIQLINTEFGVKFSIGRSMLNSMGIMPEVNFNNSKYHREYVYDDYISNGAIPLTGLGIANQSQYALYGLSLEDCANWLLGEEDYSVTDGLKVTNNKNTNVEYTMWTPNGQLRGQEEKTDDQTKYEYISIVCFTDFTGNKFVALYGITEAIKKEDYSDDNVTDEPIFQRWLSTGRVYYYGCDYTYKSNHYLKRSDVYDNVLCVKADCTVKGTAELVVPKSVVSSGEFVLTEYHRIYVLKADYPDEDGEVDVSVHSDNGDDWIGLQSTNRTETDTDYIYHYDFGVQDSVRAIKLSAVEDGEMGYLFWSGVRQEDAENQDGVKGTTDIHFENFNIVSIEPDVTYETLPAQLDIVKNLPDISAFDFMKAVFYMNGAMPKVESDGETISAMYYNQIRDRVKDGVCLDWSKKIIGSVSSSPESITFSNTNFGQRNYLDMAYTDREMTDSEKQEEVDIYKNGSGSIDIDDNTLDDEKTLYTSPFYPPYMKDLAYPNVKPGNTTKVWKYNEEGVKAINTDDVNPIYGILVYRGLDSSFEDITVNSERPEISIKGDTYKQIHLNTFNPFAESSKTYGYLKEVMSNYVKVKEKLYLDEFDLRDFDESMPVYLAKYNSCFAVSTIQRDKNGICTCEFIKLPVVEVSEEDSAEIFGNGTFSNISWGSIYLYGGSNFKKRVTEAGDWEELDSSTLSLSDICGVIAQITAETPKDTDTLFDISLSYLTGDYDYEVNGETTHYSNKVEVYVNGEKATSGGVSVNYSGVPHVQLEFRLPMCDENGNVVKTLSLTSPLFVQPTYPEEYTNTEYNMNYSLGVFGYAFEESRFAWKRSIDTTWNYVSGTTLSIPTNVIDENCNQFEVMLKCTGTSTLSNTGIKYRYDHVTITNGGEEVESVEKRVVDYASNDVGGSTYVHTGDVVTQTMYVKVEETSYDSSKKPFTITFRFVESIS